MRIDRRPRRTSTTTSQPARLPPQPGEVIDRSRRLAFRWNGGQYVGYDGDTLASALAASGVRVFSRSFKYRLHRPG
jgi:sarcosine oxidase subunit alpha